MTGGAIFLRRRLRRRWVIAVGWAIFLLGSLGVWTVRLALRPEAIRDRIQAALSALARGQVRFADPIEVDPWRLAVAVRQVSAAGPDGAEILEVARVAILPDLASLLLGRFEVREIVLESPKVSLVRRPGGAWNLLEALNLEAFSAGGPDARKRAWPRLRIRGGRVSCSVQSPPASPGEPAAGALVEFSLSDIVFLGEPRRGAVTFKGEVRHPLARHWVVAGTFHPETETLDAVVRASKVNLAGLDAVLPPPLAGPLRESRLQGFVDLEARLRGRGGSFDPPQLTGRFFRCQAEPPGAIFPIQKLSGSFTFAEGKVELRGLEGTFGDGRIGGEATLTLGPDLAPAGLDLTLEARSVPLDHRLRSKLSPELRKVLDQFQPLGTVGISLRTRARTFPPDPAEVHVRLAFNGVDFAYRAFPYPFQGLSGELSFEGGRIAVARPLTARHGDAVLTLTGGATLAGQGTAGGIEEMAFEARVEKLSADDELREAIPPDARRFWDSYQPAGQVALTVTITQEKGRAEPVAAAFVSLEGVRISYAHFPVEVRGLTGKLSFEFRKEEGKERSRLTLVDLKGEHAGQTITGLGVVEWGAREMFRVDLQSLDLAMDDEIRAAVPPTARELLNDFNFRGHARTEVVIHSAPDTGADVEVDCDLIAGEVSYALFPYPLRLEGGHLRTRSVSSIEFSGVRTRAGDKPRVVFNGGIGFRSDHRLFDFQFQIQDLDVDDRLRRALPPELKRFVEGLALEGNFSGELTGTFTCPLDAGPAVPLAAQKVPGQKDPGQKDPGQKDPGQKDPGQKDPGQKSPAGQKSPGRGGSRLVYQARGVKARDAAVNFGLALRRMEAEGTFVGKKEEDGRHTFEGEVLVKGAAFNRLQLRDAEIAFSFGRELAYLRQLREEKGGADDYRPSPELLAWIAAEGTPETFLMALKRSNLYDGIAQGLVAIEVGQRRSLRGEFLGKGVQVGKAAPDVFGVAESGASGDARGSLSFTGVTGDPLSLRGGGEGFIERARLVELPLFVGLWNGFWSFWAGKAAPQQYFNQVAIRFGISDGKFRAASPDGIAIGSSGLRLRGYGTLEFDGQLDLSLTPDLTSWRIPVVSQLLDLLKKGLAQIWVTGDLADPKIRFVSGAGAIQVPIKPGAGKSDRELPKDFREEPAEKGKVRKNF